MNTVKLSLIGVVALLIALGAAVWFASDRERWSELRRFDPSLDVLHDPQLLLAIAAKTHKNLDTTVETRHEALRALLMLQKARFGMHIPPSSDQGISIDHIYLAGELNAVNRTVTLIATPSKRPDFQAPEGEYWAMAMLVFETSGRLIDRAAYTDTTTAQ